MIRKSFVLLFIVFLLFFTACHNGEQYEFSISRNDMEKVLAEQKLNWFIKEIAAYDELQKNIITLTNEDNVIFAISSLIDYDRKVLNYTWVLPSEYTSEEINEFYHKELPELFELVGIFYGNKGNTDKSLNEFLNYYLKNEFNYENGVYWTKRIGEDHLKIEIKQFSLSDYNKNRAGMLLLMPEKSYEHYLKIKRENLKGVDSIELNEITVSEILKFNHPEDNEFVIKQFIVAGYLENIKENKTIPESLSNTHMSSILKSNKDKYLSAKLIDNTGSIDVFLLTTSLNKNELKAEREHIVTMYYYENNPVFIVHSSVLIE